MKYKIVVILFSLLSFGVTFKQRFHERITEETLLSLGFSEKAAEKVGSANWWTDIWEFYKSEAHFDDESFAAGTSRLLQFRNEIIINSNSKVKQESTWKILGKALHGLQDFYSHSTWVNTGHYEPFPLLGEFIFVPGDLEGDVCTDYETLTPYGQRSDVLSSGYFSLKSCSSFPTGKCRHGYVGCKNGLNKDEPGRPLHSEALEVARQSTAAFVSSIIGELASLEAVNFLKGLDSNRSDVDMVIVIDTTSSMTDEINQVKQTVINIITSSVKPNRYILVPFGDPSVGPAFITSSDTAILTAVNALYASGGGTDCPELGWTALQLAATNAVEGSPVFFFSDASSKDTDVFPAVQKLFVDKRLIPYMLLTGYCSSKRQASADPNYIQFTSNTGGQTFSTSPTQLARYTSLITSELSPDNTLMYLISGDMITEGTVSPNCTLKYYNATLGLDSEGNTLIVGNIAGTRTTISISIESSSYVRLFSPNKTLLVNSSQVLVSASAGGYIYVLQATEYGDYSIEICGNGRFSIRVTKISNIFVDDFRFVTIGGRYGDSFVPLPSYPVLNRMSQFLLTVHGAIDVNSTSATITFLNAVELGNVSLSIDDVENETVTYTGQMAVPVQPFYLKIRTVYNSEVVTRYSPVSRPQTVGLELIGEISRQVPNQRNYTFSFNVTNYGPSAFFAVTASISNTTASPTYTANVTALRNISIPANRSVLVNITINPKTGVIHGSTHNLVITVSSTNASNSITALLEAVSCPSCSEVGSCVANQTNQTINYVCLCPFNKRGADCSEDAHCLPANCNGHGKCNIIPYIPQCICDEGWEGSGCDTPTIPVVSFASNLESHFMLLLICLFLIVIF